MVTVTFIYLMANGANLFQLKIRQNSFTAAMRMHKREKIQEVSVTSSFILRAV